MFEVKNNVALLFGGLGGIGRCIAKELLKNNVKGLVLADVNDKEAEQFLVELTSNYGINNAIFVKVDVTKLDEVKKCFDVAVTTFSQLDIVINSVGVSESMGNMVIPINLIGSVQITMEAYNYLSKYKSPKVGQGVIVNIASGAGLISLPIQPLYSASKSAMIMFGHCYGKLKEMESELAVKTVTLCPSFTNTSMTSDVEDPRVEEHFKKNREYYRQFPIQKPESVAECVLQIIQKGENASVWISANDEPAKLFDYAGLLLSKEKLFRCLKD